MRSFILACLLFAPAIGLSADAWRLFTDKAGRKIQASVVRIEDTFVVVKLKSGGKEVPIGFDNLSDEDIDFLGGYERGNPAKESATTSETEDESAADSDPEVGKLYPKSKDEIRGVIREIEKRPRPEGISKDVQSATQQLNIYRYLSGLPYDVEADADFSKSAEDAAQACKKNGGLSHSIGQSTDKCNLSSSADIAGSVGQYIEDGGDNNREARGHRAWCLNPPMKRVGFGNGGDSYSAMWCMNSEGKSIRGSWAYPGKGLFPLEYMHGNAWSLYGAGVPRSIDDVKVKIYKLYKRPEKPFSTSDDIPGREIAVNYVSKSMMNGINFEPEEPAKRGIYWVTVRGGGMRESYLVELY